MDVRGRSELDTAFARFVSGRDPDDLAMVFDGAAPKLLLVGMHLLGEAGAAEDLLQATFLDAIRGADSFDPRRPVMPWLLKILAHRAGKMQRSGSRVMRDRIEGDLDALPSGDREPPVQVAAKEVIAQIVAAVESLSKSYREVLLLRLVHDLQPAEIAHTLDRPVGTVHVQLQRGLARLRRILPKSLAGALALLVGAERGLAAVRQRVLEEVGRQVLPVVSTVVGGLWMKKFLAAAAAVLVLLASGTWVMLGVDREGATSLPLTPELSPVDLGVVAAITTQVEPLPTPVEQRHLLAAPNNQVAFSGRIVAKESGAPIVGAEVHLSAFPSSPGDPSASDWKDPSVVLSDSDGLFRIAIDHHPEMRLSFLVEVPGRVTTVGDVSDLRKGVSLELGDIEMIAACELRFRVIDESGQPVDSYPLHLYLGPSDSSAGSRGLLSLRPRGWGGVVFTDAEGRVPPAILPPGRWIVLERGFQGFGLVGPPEILVEPGDETKDVTIVLSNPKAEEVVSGTVVDTHGVPMAGFMLKAKQVSVPGGTSTRSRSDGSFIITGKSELRGSLRIHPGDLRHFRIVSPTDYVDLGTSDLELVVRRVEAVPMAIVVVDETGAPVEAFRYCLVPVRQTGIGTRVLEIGLKFSAEKQHPDGRLEPEGVMPGSYLLYVRGEDSRFAVLQSMSINVRHGGNAQNLRMVLEDVHLWRVRIVEEGGKPVAGSRVEFLQAFGENKIRLGDTAVSAERYLAGAGGGWNLSADEAISDESGIAELQSAWTFGGAAVRVTGPIHRPALVPVTAPGPVDEVLEIVIQGAGVIEGVINPLDVVLLWGPSEEERQRAALKTSFAEDLAQSMPEIVASLLGADYGGQNTVRCPIDQQGRFRLESLLPGDWELFFHGGSRYDLSGIRRRVEVVRKLRSGEIRRIERSLPELQLAQIRGVALVDGELPVAMQLVLEGPAVVDIPLDSAGRFESLRLPAGSYSPFLLANEYTDEMWRIGADAHIDISPGESVDLVLRFWRHYLSVRILDADGVPVGSRWVTLETPGWGERKNPTRLHRQKSDADGRVIFDPVHRGDLDVLVWDESTLDSRGPGLTRFSKNYVRLGPIRLRSDRSTTEVELRMPARK